MINPGEKLEKDKFYIIGQGLAGSVLAMMMIEEGLDITIIDDGHLSSSSAIAAGMWNPVMFKKLTESWMARDFIHAADEVYVNLEKRLAASFYHPLDLVRIFTDIRSSNEWDERSVHPELASFLLNTQDQDVARQFIQPYGHGVVGQAGWMDIPLFLKHAKAYFLKKDRLIIQPFTDDDLNELTAIKSNVIIYCIGWKSLSQAAFNWVPLIPNKGEVLTIRSESLDINRLINFGKFLIPLGNHEFRLGATYDLNQPDVSISQEAKLEMLNQLREVFDHDVEVVDHQSGYRPTVPDRKPVIGFHPENNQLAIFNGFGSKGVMLIPYFAAQFVKLITSKEKLLKDVDVRRYWNKPAGTYDTLLEGFLDV